MYMYITLTSEGSRDDPYKPRPADCREDIPTIPTVSVPLGVVGQILHDFASHPLSWQDTYTTAQQPAYHCPHTSHRTNKRPDSD